jgi:hypothetical protein
VYEPAAEKVPLEIDREGDLIVRKDEWQFHHYGPYLGFLLAKQGYEVHQGRHRGFQGMRWQGKLRAKV